MIALLGLEIMRVKWNRASTNDDIEEMVAFLFDDYRVALLYHGGTMIKLKHHKWAKLDRHLPLRN